MCTDRKAAGIITLCLLLVASAPTARAGAADNPWSLIRQGITAYRAGAPAHAVSWFVQASSDQPTSSLPLVWAGVASVAAARSRDAARYFALALSRPHSTEEARIAQAWLERLAALERPTRFTGSDAWGTTDAPTRIAALARASNPRLTWGNAVWIGQHLVAAAADERIDPWLLASVVFIESRFNHQNRQRGGSHGDRAAHAGDRARRRCGSTRSVGNLLGAAETLRGDYLTSMTGRSPSPRTTRARCRAPLRRHPSVCRNALVRGRVTLRYITNEACAMSCCRFSLILSVFSRTCQ